MPRANTELRRQSRKVILNVTNFMIKEKEEGVQNVKKVYQRVADATGISTRTVGRIAKEGKSLDLISVFRTPGKKRPRPKPITDINHFDRGALKRYIHNFYKTENELPTVKKLMIKLQNDINFQGGRTSVKQIVEDLSFRWRKTESKRYVLIEKQDIRLKRIEYLQKIKKYREENRPIVYADELFIHSTQTKPKACSDGSQDDLKEPFLKGQRVVIVHAGSKDGFIPNGLLMFKSDPKSGDHDDMNFTKFEEWLRTQLIPNLKPHSVVVIDNAPYHDKLVNPTPKSNSKKEDMESWLFEKGVSFDQNMHKLQLYQLIEQHKDVHKIYRIDQIFADYNHDVLRLPPYHPDLNPIEMAWTAIKEHVSANNVSWTVDRTMELVREKVDMIGEREWAASCRKLEEIEEEYRKSDHIVDEMTETFIICSNGSSSDSETDSDCDSSETERNMTLPSTSRGTFMERMAMMSDSE